MRIVRWLIVVVGAACGSSPGSKEVREPAPVVAPVAERQAEQQETLRNAQAVAVHAMCERLVQCSVEDARRTMSAAEVEGLDLAATVPRAVATCQDEASRSTLSPRQIKVVRRCVNEAASCPALTTCLDAARKTSTP